MFKLNKKDLRKQGIDQLKRLSQSNRLSIENLLVKHLVTSEIWKNATTVGITMSGEFEWNTKPIIEMAWKQGKTVCVPKCRLKDHQMDFFILNTYNQLEVVYSNLLEPDPNTSVKVSKDMIDLLIVPGVVFSYEGFRIGFGGGFYDRFLKDFPNDNLSLAATMQFVDQLPVEPYDVPVNHIITENGFLTQGGK